VGGWAEASAFYEDGFFVEDFGWLKDLALGAKHGGTAESELDQFQADEAIVDGTELDAFEFNDIDLDSTHCEFVEEAFNELLRLVMKEEGAVEEIDANDSKSLLLEGGFGIQHANVDKDLAWFVARAGLKFHAHPSMAFVAAFETASNDGIGEGEEGGVVTSFVTQSFDVELQFAVEHGLKA
jgi:hypothetical protein